MAYELPPLPYPKNALEPHIDAQTMEIHHDKHHAAYVTNVNKAIAGKVDLEKKTVEDLISNLDAVPADIDVARMRVLFRRPGAVILRARGQTPLQ